VLTPTEITAINQRLSDYNAAISAAAAARDIPVVDINALFNSLKQGEQVGPFSLSLGYAIGGVVSLDGYHLTDIGYALFANEYIKTINSAYGTHIPLSGLWQFLQNNDTTHMTSELPIFDNAAAKALNMLEPPATAPRKRLSVGH